MAARSSAKRWLPLEANPDVMNQFLWGLGVSPNEAECYDVFGLDEELLGMVPKPTEEERIQQDSLTKAPVDVDTHFICFTCVNAV